MVCIYGDWRFNGDSSSEGFNGDLFLLNGVFWDFNIEIQGPLSFFFFVGMNGA